MSWQQVQSFDRHLVQGLLVHAEAQTTIGLLDKEYGHRQRQVVWVYGTPLE